MSRYYKADGVHFIGPARGEMAEAGEAGVGRMAEPLDIVAAVLDLTGAGARSTRLAGRRVLITSGPTVEAVDPVRYIANRSSGKQGHAIAAAAAADGAAVTLVSGPVSIPDPPGVKVIHVESARDMLAAVEAALPVDVAVMAAAVADWRPAKPSRGKIKKDGTGKVEPLQLVENPDILATIGRHHTLRPTLVIGFAAETADLVKNAKAKLKAKGADWILANDVSEGSGVMGGDDNTVSVVSAAGVEAWPKMTKTEVAAKLVERIADCPAPPPRGRGVSDVTVLVRRLPHGDGLPVPAPKSTLAAGADLAAAVPEGETLTIFARRAGAGADRVRHRDSRGIRGPGAPALRPRRRAWRHRAQHARHDRCRLSRRAEGDPRQSRRPAVRDHAGHADRATRHRAGDRRRLRRGGGAAGHGARRQRIRLDRNRGVAAPSGEPRARPPHSGAIYLP